MNMNKSEMDNKGRRIEEGNAAMQENNLDMMNWWKIIEHLEEKKRKDQAPLVTTRRISQLQLRQ